MPLNKNYDSCVDLLLHVQLDSWAQSHNQYQSSIKQSEHARYILKSMNQFQIFSGGGSENCFRNKEKESAQCVNWYLYECCQTLFSYLLSPIYIWMLSSVIVYMYSLFYVSSTINKILVNMVSI